MNFPDVFVFVYVTDPSCTVIDYDLVDEASKVSREFIFFWLIMGAAGEGTVGPGVHEAFLHIHLIEVVVDHVLERKGYCYEKDHKTCGDQYDYSF